MTDAKNGEKTVEIAKSATFGVEYYFWDLKRGSVRLSFYCRISYSSSVWLLPGTSSLSLHHTLFKICPNLDFSFFFFQKKVEDITIRSSTFF